MPAFGQARAAGCIGGPEVGEWTDTVVRAGVRRCVTPPSTHRNDLVAARTCEPEGVRARVTAEQPRNRLPEIALAACAGASDLLAVLTHGGAFASVITGNLILVGAESVTGGGLDMLAPATAVGGFAIGVAIWSLLGRSRPQAVVGLLAAELVLLIGYAVGWLMTAGQPGTVTGAVMLAAVAGAMGGQSVVSLRMRAYTTYLTGALTTAVQDLIAHTSERRLTGLRQLAALVAGAAVAGLLLRYLRWSAPLLAPLLLTVAITELWRTHFRSPLAKT